MVDGERRQQSAANASQAKAPTAVEAHARRLEEHAPPRAAKAPRERRRELRGREVAVRRRRERLAARELPELGVARQKAPLAADARRAPQGVRPQVREDRAHELVGEGALDGRELGVVLQRLLVVWEEEKEAWR